MIDDYFPYGIQVRKEQWDRLGLGEVRGALAARGGAVPGIVFLRYAAARLNRQPDRRERPVQARDLNLYVLLTRIFRHVVARYAAEQAPDALARAAAEAGLGLEKGALAETLAGLAELFPPAPVLDGRETPQRFLAEDAEGRRRRTALAEALLLRVTSENPAVDDFRVLVDDRSLTERTPYAAVAARVEDALRKLPPVAPFGLALPDLLRAPTRAAPASLASQLEYVRENWFAVLPDDLLRDVLTAFDLYREEEREWWGTAGPPQVLEFGEAARRRGGARFDYPEPEAFSADADWMSNVVLIAKMTYVWLDQLSKRHGREIRRLDQIPDEELDRLARWGFSGLWLIGLWERSPASQKIKQIAGNPDAISSAYSLYDYVPAADLGGEEALASLRERAIRRGIRLASDMVPNHCGLWSRWLREHPDWFIQADWPPYPNYTFGGPDLSYDPSVSLRIEDGYWERRDAAVVFQHVDHGTGRVRYVYHGNDGTSTPWNDTAQLDYMKPEVREAVIRTILHVARQFPIIRFDAAMTLAKLHFQRLWYPQPGQGGGVPSRAERGLTRDEFDRAFPTEFWREVVDRVAAEAPGTLLLAEAFWLMEGYFVRTLGMHRVYNSAFMNMLKMEDNAKYRQTIKNVLEFNPEILKRFVNFMNNPDERTAVEQFGKEGKYVGAAVLLATMPGLPMFGHGQIEGFHEKYGMEYRRAYWDEPVDEGLVAVHEERVFPLMRKRYLFSGSENFALYDFWAGDHVNEDVFAYSNRAGGERAVIVYHNRFASTAGWIRTTAAFAVKDGAGGTRLEQTTLAHALSLDPRPGRFYAFRDWATGLEYLRSGRDLADHGLYAELGAFQYQALLDWRDLWDADGTTWGRLCERLGGRGVRSLDTELKEVRFGDVVRCLTELLAEARARLDDLFDPASPGTRETAAAFVLDRFGALADAVAAEGRGGPIGVAAIREAFGRELASAAGSPPADEHGRVALVCALAMRRLGEVAGREGAPARTSAWLDDFGILRAATRFLGGVPAEGGGAGVPDGTILRVIVTRPGFVAEAGSDAAGAVRAVFSDPLVREAVGLHWSGGREWFNKERFEDVVAWLARMAAIDEGPRATPGLRRTARDLVAAAEAAGWRADRLVEVLGAASPKPRAPKPRKPRQVR